MALRDILICLPQDKGDDARIEFALKFAAEMNARLNAVFVIPPVHIPGYVAMYIPPEALEPQRAEAQARADAAKEKFEAAAANHEVTAEFRVAHGDPRDMAAMHACYSDLVIVGQSERSTVRDLGFDLAEELVLTAGRPVLVVPYAGRFPEVGTKVMVAWNGTREATRAVHDSLPILARAEQVLVYSVNPTDEEHIPGADIATHLARHGVRADAHKTVGRDLDVGDIVLSAISDHGVNLLVMGAYGHSRLRELALGGATRQVLETMTVPVLMSH
jgi:nucleotide-binding universal stress UspA family protein